MRKLTEEERHLLNHIKNPPSKWFWTRLALWDVFKPNKRDRFLANHKAGKSVYAALKDV